MWTVKDFKWTVVKKWSIFSVFLKKLWSLILAARVWIELEWIKTTWTSELGELLLVLERVDAVFVHRVVPRALRVFFEIVWFRRRAPEFFFYKPKSFQNLKSEFEILTERARNNLMTWNLLLLNETCARAICRKYWRSPLLELVWFRAAKNESFPGPPLRHPWMNVKSG